jgi:hypothetical protein
MNTINTKVGEVGWEDVETPKNDGSARPKSGGLFLNMKDAGDYKIRIVSKPHQYYCHWIEIDLPGGKKQRKKVNATLDGNDPICIDQGKGPQMKWLFKVLYRDPKEGTTLRLLDAGPQIVAQIKKLHNNKENFGNVSKYDIIISKGAKGANPLYTIQATGNEKNAQNLTQDELKLVRESSDKTSDKFVDIEKMCKPWTAQQILDAMSGKKSEDKTVVSTTVSASTEDDLFQDPGSDADFIDL